jgi:hypothetical protein
MRTLMMALVVAGVLATSSQGVVNVKVVADGPIVSGKVQLANSASTTIRILGQGTTAGLFALAGSVRAGAGNPVLLTSVGPMVFAPEYNPTGLFTPKPGVPGPNGGWENFGTQQTDWGTPDSSLGRAAYIEVCHYTITALPAGTGDVTLSFTYGLTISGYKPLETDKTGVLGTLTPVTIHVPEPIGMALLALGSLVLTRRRA